MKKILIFLGIFIGLILILSIISPYKIKTICFGDVCPDNGGTYLLYKKTYTQQECESIGSEPVVGFGWGPVYAGCSPNNFFSRLINSN